MKSDIKKWNWQLKLLGWRYIPLLRKARPKVLQINEETCEVLIVLRRSTKNHLQSMYFGALAMGADTAAGLLCFYLADKEAGKLHFSFKSADMNFLKRADSDVVFKCEDGALIQSALKKAKESKERVNQKVLVNSYNSDGEIVAEMKMEVSLKLRA